MDEHGRDEHGRDERVYDFGFASITITAMHLWGVLYGY